MKKVLLCLPIVGLLAACGRNEPGTMGGEPGTPETVATGAPAQAQNGQLDSDQPARPLEQKHNTFESNPTGTNAAGQNPQNSSQP